MNVKVKLSDLLKEKTSKFQNNRDIPSQDSNSNHLETTPQSLTEKISTRKELIENALFSI